MLKKIIGILIVVFIIGAFFIPIGSVSNTGESSLVVTYGETTYNNEEYKKTVEDYFSNEGYDLNNVQEEIITSYDVNEISKNITSKTYNENQIFSCAFLDLNSGDDINVDVDKSKITTVTESMYKSALNSSGITKGHVIVTSPTTATGESALAGILKSYEAATGTQIPTEVKDAANNEIYSQSEVVNNSNVSADDVANLVTEAKDEAAKQNTTDQQTIINIVNNIASNNNINISSNDTTNLADSIAQSQSVQDQANDYQQQISDKISSGDGQTLFEIIWNSIQSIINGDTYVVRGN